MNNHTNKTCNKKDKANTAADNDVDHSFDFGFTCVTGGEESCDEDDHTFNLDMYKQSDEGKKHCTYNDDTK